MTEPPSPGVLSYEAAGDVPRRRWPRVAMWVLAVGSLLVGLGEGTGGVVTVFEAIGSFDEPEAVFWGPVMAVAAMAGALATVGAVMLIARRGGWRVPVMLTVAAAANMLVALAMMGLCVAFRRATGWDTLVVAIGMLFAGAATVTAWTYAATAALALRVARAEGEPLVADSRTLSRCLILIAVLPAAAGAIAWLLYAFLP